MTKYQKIQTGSGARYLVDGKMTAYAKLRPHIQEQLGTKDEVLDNSKFCLFCDEPAKPQRLVNGQLVDLCEKDYYDKRIGQIAQKLREDDHGQEAKETVDQTQTA